MNTQITTSDTANYTAEVKSKIESVTKDFIPTEISFLKEEAKAAGVMVSKYDPVGNNNISGFVTKHHRELLDNIAKASLVYDVVEFLNSLGYKTFHYGKALSVYVDENNFFYATRKVC